MFKYLKYMFVAAIAMIAATGCQEDWEDTFSKAPAAPELLNNGSILMTQNTMTESVTWAWSAARFLKGEVSYSLYVQYGEGTAKQLGAATKELTLTLPKTDLRSALTSLAGVPENASFDVAFYVEAKDEEATYASAKQTVKVYAYGDAVSPVATLVSNELVLDVTAPTANVDLLTWEAARLGYNEAITYSVFAQYGENEAVAAATDLTATAYSLTVDELNELVVSAGAPEAEAADVNFFVTAYSESCPDGVPSASVTMNITTYVATYPATVWLPGSYQGWDPATAAKINQSTLTKGLYEAFVNLTTADGSDVEFKFTPTEGGWDNDWGLAEEVAATTDANGNVVLEVATVDMDGEKNIKVPSGIYRVSMNKKLNKLTLVKIESVGLIGSATANGWDAETPMAYDTINNTFSVVTTLTKGGEYKFRINNNWTYSIGDNGAFDGGANYVLEKDNGEYKVVLDANQHPYGVKVLSTALPTEEYIYIPGNHQGWAPPTAQALKTDAFDGIYKGFSYLDGDFKFTKQRAWGEATDEWNSTHFATYEGGLAASTDGTNINMATPGFYYIVADVMDGKLSATATSWGIIGPAQAGEWSTDTDMTWNAADESWTATVELAAGEFKFRANDDWAINVGGSLTDLTADGGNIMLEEAGTYEVKLFLTRSASNKMYCTMTKK
ncbi:MAG: SusF/SusE family outer membrane protein [Bacteroides sp.]|nr:SusF/SusE family outer membrane protein [Bacteroides sp.]